MRYVNSKLRNDYGVSTILDNESSVINSGIQSHLNILVDRIIDRASGVSLWVRLVVKQLLEDLTAGMNMQDLYQHLQTLPNDLHDVYRYIIIKKIPRQDRFEAYIMLESVFRAMSPLSIAQLDLIVRLALGRLSIEDDHPRTSEWVQATAPDMERRTVHCCRGLLEVHNNQVQMLHQTVKEYFSRSVAFEPWLGAGYDVTFSTIKTSYNSFLLTK